MNFPVERDVGTKAKDSTTKHLRNKPKRKSSVYSENVLLVIVSYIVSYGQPWPRVFIYYAERNIQGF